MDLSKAWNVVVPGASRESIERLLGFAKEHRLGSIGSGVSSRTVYDRVYLASTNRLMVRLLSATLGERGAGMEPVDRYELEGVIEDLTDRADAVRESVEPIVGDYDFRLGFAPVLTEPDEEVWWSTSISGLNEERALRIARYAESVGIRAWPVDPHRAIALMLSRSQAVDRLVWLVQGWELCKSGLSRHEDEVVSALVDDMRHWFATADESSEFVVRYDL